MDRSAAVLAGLAMLAITASCRTVARPPAAAALEPYVGFIWHYPFADAGSDRLAASGANVLMARCAWGAVGPAAGAYDFSTVGRQLQVARGQGVRLVLLLEFNPFCTPGWLRTACRAAGETVAGPDGAVQDIPRTGSAVFRAAQEDLLRGLCAFLAREDPQHTVTHYLPGIEWWFPFEWRYAADDTTRFRTWLAGRYGSLTWLNRTWGTAYTGFAEAQVPALSFHSPLWEQGRTGLASVDLAFVPARESGPAVPLAAVQDWDRFWHQTAAAYIDSLATLVRRFDRSRPCVSFGSLVWAQGAEWDYTDWSQMGADWLAHGAADLAVIGLQLPFHHGDTYRQTLGLDTARKYGHPLWDMDLTDFALGHRAGPAAHRKAAHAAVQHGATGLFFCNWNGDPDFDLYPNWSLEEVAEVVGQSRRALEVTRGFRPVVQGLLINPIAAAVLPGDPPWGRNDARSLMGWYKLLERLPCTVDVATLTEVAEGWVGLDAYPWVLVPDCAFVPERALAALTRFARRGGLLLRGGRLGPYDENGVARPSRVAPGVALGDLGLAYAGREAMPRRSLVNPPPVVVWRPETPESVQIREQALATVRQTLAQAHIAEPVAVDTLGRDVRAAILQRGATYLVYLVNRETEPVSGVRLQPTRHGLAPGTVRLDLEPQDPRDPASGDAVVLPAFQDSAMVEFVPRG